MADGIDPGRFVTCSRYFPGRTPDRVKPPSALAVASGNAPNPFQCPTGNSMTWAGGSGACVLSTIILMLPLIDSASFSMTRATGGGPSPTLMVVSPYRACGSCVRALTTYEPGPIGSVKKLPVFA